METKNNNDINVEKINLIKNINVPIISKKERQIFLKCSKRIKIVFLFILLIIVKFTIYIIL